MNVSILRLNPNGLSKNCACNGYPSEVNSMCARMRCVGCSIQKRKDQKPNTYPTHTYLPTITTWLEHVFKPYKSHTTQSSRKCRMRNNLKHKTSPSLLNYELINRNDSIILYFVSKQYLRTGKG